MLSFVLLGATRVVDARDDLPKEGPCQVAFGTLEVEGTKSDPAPRCARDIVGLGFPREVIVTLVDAARHWRAERYDPAPRG